ncbi:hypothetical protein [Streptomyces sp. enrichment culture]|uniref:hypothetical protein n=1 Tax=Streptomyces sp. enrichment culture TaxID=1795815 RepID=UPI003F5734A8
MDSEQPVCPACGQPVQTVVRRHKTLGAWVPVWVHGPCHNPECEDYVAREPGGTGRAEDTRRAAGTEGPGAAGDRTPAQEPGRTTVRNV